MLIEPGKRSIREIRQEQQARKTSGMPATDAFMRGAVGEEVRATSTDIEEMSPDKPSKFLGDLRGEEKLQEFKFAQRGSDLTAEELAARQDNPGFGGQFVDFVSAAGAEAVAQVGEGLANLSKATDIINPVSYLARKMGEPTPGEIAQRGFQKLADQPREVQEKLGTTKTTGGKAGTVTGAIAGTLGAQVPALVGGAELLGAVKGLPIFQKLSQASPDKASRLADFITKSVGSTEIITQVEEGRSATPFEIGAFGVMDAALFGLGKLGRSLYKSAFKAPTKGQERNLVKSFDTTAADIAEELGYVGKPENILKATQEKQKTIFSEIQRLAATKESVSRQQFIDTVLPSLTKKFDDLPESEMKQQLIAAVTEAVETFAPTVSATGDELVSTITNINRELFGEGARTVLTPKQAASIEKQMSSGVKDLLPQEIQPLYERYAKESLIEDIMQEARIQRLLMRSLIGGAAGAASGAIPTISAGEDLLDVLKATIAGAIIGTAAGRSTGAIQAKTVGGTILKNAPSTKEMFKIILRKIFPGEEG